MMLVKEIYDIPGEFALVELPGGDLYRFKTTPSRPIKKEDLELVELKVPKAVYLSSTGAEPYYPGLRGLMFKMYGLTDSQMKAARESAGLTQKELAEKAGVNVSQIQKAESGEIKAGNMASKNLLAIADVLGIDPRSLISE